MNDQDKFYETYGQPTVVVNPTKPEEPQFEQTPQPNQPSLAKRILGITIFILFALGLFFVGGIFVIGMIALFLIGTIVRILMPGRSSATHLVIKR